MSPACDGCSRVSCNKHFCDGGDDISLLSAGDLYTGLLAEADGSPYKRRKLGGNAVALLARESVASIKPRFSNCMFSSCNSRFSENGGCPLISERSVCDHASVFSSAGESLQDSVRRKMSVIGNDMDSISSHESDLEISSEKENTSLDDCWSLSANSVECSSESMDLKGRRKVANASSGAVETPIGEFESTKELCISVLKSHGLMGGRCNSSACPAELPGFNDDSSLLPCKVCGQLYDPLKMLICDLCEGAFHLSCCDPKIKEEDIEFDDWYCEQCFAHRPRPKPFLQASLRYRKYTSEKLPYGDRVSAMLVDTEPYLTSVQIGNDFQVEVPDWCQCAKSSIDDDYFGEPSELDLSAALPSWNTEKSKSYGNWLQCREVTGTDEDGEDIICGKWRRAPLSMHQTEDWDCSCAVTWDPVHADCAVPQELPTSEVKKQLKFVEKVNSRLASGKLHVSEEPWPPSQQGPGEE